MNNQKRLIFDFRNFIQKVFIPTLKKTDSAYNEWNKFAQLLNNQPLNLEQIHLYVESINNNPNPYDKREIPLFKKKKEDDALQVTDTAFNPSKTFGGERAKMMLNKGEIDDFGQQKRETGTYGNVGMSGRVAPQVILPGLQKLCKIFVQNQQKIQNQLNNANKSPIKKYG